MTNASICGCIVGCYDDKLCTFLAWIVCIYSIPKIRRHAVVFSEVLCHPHFSTLSTHFSALLSPFIMSSGWLQYTSSLTCVVLEVEENSDLCWSKKNSHSVFSSNCTYIIIGDDTNVSYFINSNISKAGVLNIVILRRSCKAILFWPSNNDSDI